MANYTAACRSNYFRVKDADAFTTAMDNIPDIMVEEQKHGKYAGYFIITGDNADGGGWPGCCYDDETGEEFEVDLAQEVAPHLIDDEVAVFLESGSEKLRYLTGVAFAVNNKGKEVVININEIYEKAKKKLGANVTAAEY